MGHHSAKDVYRELVEKLDGSTARMPDHAALRTILTELYTPEEADLVARMPWGLCRLDRVADVTGEKTESLLVRLNALADKGLVLDLVKESTGEHFFMPSPFMIGVFEFTMMRAGPSADHARRARLFHEYIEQGDFCRANLGNGQQVFVVRALPHTDCFDPSTEILDTDRVEAIVEQTTQFSVGVCSCRHEQEHLEGRKCKTPLENCTALGTSAGYLIRHGLARSIERSEMRNILARSRDLGLVLCADNVKYGVGFICHCCTCCCNFIRGITEVGYANVITTSSYAPLRDSSLCNGCGLCVNACPVKALSSVQPDTRPSKDAQSPTLDTARCLGCGICVTRCNRDALKLVPGTRRRILPENTFERVILQSLERGTLQNLMFDNPRSHTQQAMRALLGGVLRLPQVKRALLSDAFRSTFLRGLASISGYDGP